MVTTVKRVCCKQNHDGFFKPNQLVLLLHGLKVKPENYISQLAWLVNMLKKADGQKKITWGTLMVMVCIWRLKALKRNQWVNKCTTDMMCRCTVIMVQRQGHCALFIRNSSCKSSVWKHISVCCVIVHSFLLLSFPNNYQKLNIGAIFEKLLFQWRSSRTCWHIFSQCSTKQKGCMTEQAL